MKRWRRWRLYRRRLREAAEADLQWTWVNRTLAYEMATEISTWADPIDVIRKVLGLPLRWQVTIGDTFYAAGRIAQDAYDRAKAMAAAREAARVDRGAWFPVGEFEFTIPGKHVEVVFDRFEAGAPRYKARIL